jgi:hypothetical protein
MHGTIPPLLTYVFMAWCLVKHRDNFTFTLSLQDEAKKLLPVIFGLGAHSALYPMYDMDKAAII